MKSHRPLPGPAPLRSITRRQMVAGTAGVAAGIRLVHPTMAQDASPATSPVAQPDMGGAVHPFEFGSFSCLAVSDGASMSPEIATFLFAGSPPDEVETALRETGTDPNMLVNHHTSIVIDTGEQMVLVDTGSGPGASPTDGLLLGNLQSAGIAPEDIDVVILTHGHPDHIGGNADADGNPTFTNARYVMSQEDWDFWTDESRVEQAIPVPEFRELLLSFVRQHLIPLRDHFDLIGYDEEILPGIQSIAAQGHTPGHMALLVQSEGDQLWVAGDMALHPINLPYPDLVGLVDVEPERMRETRRRLLGRMADEGGLVALYHFHPFPSLGHVEAQGEAWIWQPVPPDAASPAP